MYPERELRLLRAYEPVLRFTRGELFLPCSVSEYAAGSALYRRDPAGDRCLAAAGTLDLDRLAALARRERGADLYLRYVTDPINRRQFRRWRHRTDRQRFRPASRFAAVGLAPRLVDSALRLTLVLRGKVPARFAAAAEQRYRASPDHGRAYYYGHVSRDGGYVVLQYWFFYPMNDWRSTFGGINDHEADWEQVTIFLADQPDGGDDAGPRPVDDRGPRPAWVAFSAHDEVGDDLRRRWDDPDLERVGDHPVVYAGAGSHSGGYLPGDYLITAPLPLPGWLNRFRMAVLRRLPWVEEPEQVIGIPYLDYRRGDGAWVGPGEPLGWIPVPIDDETAWVRDFRGLWGLDTRDPLGGERAPAGPRYDRNGAVRECWARPVAWAGLDKQAPNDAWARRRLAERRADLVATLADADRDLDAAREGLRAGRAADRAAGRDPADPAPATAAMAEQVDRLRGTQADLSAQIEASDAGLSAPLPAEGVHAHLRRRSVPVARGRRRGGRLMRLWAAGSTSFLLLALGLILINGRHGIRSPLTCLIITMIVIEAILRRRLLALTAFLAVTGVVVCVGWAVVTALLGNFEQGVGVLLLLAGGYMAWQTLREGLRIR